MYGLPNRFHLRKKQLLERLSDSVNFQPKPDKNEKGFFEKVKEMFS